MSSRKYFMTSFCLTILLLIAVATLNYRIDPAGLFRPMTYEDGIADILNSGRNVANLSNYDERLVQRYYIRKLIKKRDVIVLGSSRVMQIPGSLFVGRSFLNNGVSGATLEDDIAIFQMYRERGLIPDTVLVGFDPWVLNTNNGQTRWQAIEDEYRDASVHLGFSNPEMFSFLKTRNYKKCIELVSLQYFQASLKGLKSPAQLIDYYPTDSVVLSVPVKLKDGTISYPDSIRNKSVEEVRASAVEYANTSLIQYFKGYEELDEEQIMKLSAFIEDLKSNKIQVVLFLAPFHPEIYNVFLKDARYRMVLESEKFLKEFAQRKGVKLIGSYDPSQYQLSGADFYDGIHIKEDTVKKIFTGRL